MQAYYDEAMAAKRSLPCDYILPGPVIVIHVKVCRCYFLDFKSKISCNCQSFQKYFRQNYRAADIQYDAFFQFAYAFRENLKVLIRSFPYSSSIRSEEHTSELQSQFHLLF